LTQSSSVFKLPYQNSATDRLGKRAEAMPESCRRETAKQAAEKGSECFDKLGTNGKMRNHFEAPTVRPEALEG
jgi:hypothetical protein